MAAKPKRGRPEALLQEAVAQYLDAALDPRYAMARGIENNPRSPIAGAQQRKRGVLPGTADILIWWTARNGNKGFGAVELKAKGNYQDPNQAIFETRFSAIGGKYEVCYSQAEVEAALKAWGVPTRIAK